MKSNVPLFFHFDFDFDFFFTARSVQFPGENFPQSKQINSRES